MNRNVRNYFDNETRKNLQESIPNELLRNDVEAAYDESCAAILRKEVELQEIYKSLPALLRATSAASGVSQEMLLTTTRRIAASSRDMEWYQVLNMINSFYRIKSTLEEEKP